MMDVKTIDGPYVFYKNDTILVNYVREDQALTSFTADSFALAAKNDITLNVLTDEDGITFPVKLKQQLVNEPSIFPAPSKMMIISDIEGNFTAFKKLLIGNGIMDSSYNWVFGNGHLVLVGDFVDRGDKVTEVLWLIYSLEEKAKLSGGYIHFVLGNHEIMIMSGDSRYVNAKYKIVSHSMQLPYEALYGENTELGRWLRTKNIMEKIGDDIFIHAGISQEVNKLRLSIENINSMARPFFADSSYVYPDKGTGIIMGNGGPFWFRGYYSKEIPDVANDIDRTLNRYKARHIFTGHSIVADTVSVWYKGKLINTDVKHADQKSEGVLMTGGKYYRVNSKGEHFPLSVK
jgi:hypothetical protein